MKVLVTGAAGRLGSIVARQLLDTGLDVVATDQRSWAGIPVPVRVESLLDPLACYRLLEGVDALVHLANHPNIGAATPQRVFGENCTMNGNVLQAASELGVRRVVFSSTIQTVVGIGNSSWAGHEDACELPYLPMDGDLPVNPSNAYAASKIATEEWLKGLCRHHGMHAVALRLPWLMRPEDATSGRRRRPTYEGWGRTEAFAYLRSHDAAELIAAIVRGQWQGYRCYLPADARTINGLPPRHAYERYLSPVPLRVPLDELTTLVDCSALQRDFGWTQPGSEQNPAQPAGVGSGMHN